MGGMGWGSGTLWSVEVRAGIANERGPLQKKGFLNSGIPPVDHSPFAGVLICVVGLS